jgi:hypothetical protein
MQENKKNKSWLRDKKGEIFTELVAEPVVNKVKKIMNNYAVKKSDTYFDEDSEESIGTKISNVKEAIQLNNLEATSKLKKNIVKHAVGKFSLNNKKNIIEYNNNYSSDDE